MSTNSHIHVCICTYNRLDYLKRCLTKLIPQKNSNSLLISVVDNNSSDGTKAYVDSLHLEVQYLFESRQGLSNARNMAWQASSSEWIFYLDDDCLPSETLLRNAIDLIQHHPNVDAFGGPIDAVFEGPFPDWLPEGFGSFSMPHAECTQIETGFIRGGCFLIRRKVLEDLGGFDDRLGVAGKSLQYGEELELQLRMRRKNYSIAYAPSLQVGHYVRTEKMSLCWVLHSAYARRRDKMLFEPIPLGIATLNLFRTFVGRLFWTPVYFGKAIFSHSSGFKKALYQIAQPLAYRLGEWMGVVKGIFGKRISSID